ncbi:hypothetical protein FDECE_7999 [Fusarium decemcellulare]|nr:hypothetical protein FDECE_7999 [Fusarium decemcellulare]
MASFQTHLSLLESRAAQYRLLPVLKVPQQTPTGTSWKNITFPQFQKDVEASARYWVHQFSQKGFKERSVVGIWLKGLSYLDLTHIWGIARAGFIPQPISLRMTDPTVMYELLSRTNAVALIHDPSFKSFLSNSPVPIWPGEEIPTSDVEPPLPSLWMPSQDSDIIMIYHTSGSTMGTPKLVPVTARWLDYTIEKMNYFIPSPPSSKRQQVIVAGGSFCHMASTVILIGSIGRGGSMVLPSNQPYTTRELGQMIDDCELTVLNMFSTFLSKVLDEARSDPALLAALKGLDYIVYSGLPLGVVDETWGREQGLKLFNCFACTEVGIMMQSFGGRAEDQPHFVTLAKSAMYEFVPVSDGSDSSEELLELVVPPESPDCPALSLRNPEDGKFHTGDLFTEIVPGQYLSKGRNDDWIKMESAMRCDTGSIERNAMQTCGDDLVDAAVVVGARRPSPVLMVEPKDGVTIKPEDKLSQLKNEILQRVTPFHKRRYLHERIDDTQFILVVPKGSLPRTVTKGNIQRKKAEESFKEELDKIYSASRLPVNGR